MNPTGPYYRCTDLTDPAAVWNTQRNRQDLRLWRILAPPDDEDVDTAVSNLTSRSGQSKNTILTWVMIVKLLENYPRLAAHNEALGLLDFPRLRAIERGLMAVTDTRIITELDHRLTEYLTPTRPSQVLPGPKAIAKFIRNLLKELDPPAAEKESDPERHGIDFSTSGHGEMNINITLPEDQGHEVKETLALMSSQTPQATMLDCLLELIRGELPPRVVHNVYGPAGTPPAYLAGGGWLDDRQAEQWTDRVTDTRDMDAAERETTKAYRPTEGIARAVKGRDGSCRFPADCNIDAKDCELDHVINHADGGETAVHNLQSLCPHHHNVKTGRRMMASMDEDGIVTWTYPDGTTAVTFPQGPLTKENKLFGQTFAQRRAKRIRERRQRNETPKPPGIPEEPPF